MRALPGHANTSPGLCFCPEAYGYWPAAQLLNCGLFFAVESKKDLAKHIEIAHQKGHHIFESEHVRKNGTVFPVLIDVTAVKNEIGEVDYRVVNVQDISKRKQTENTL